MTQHRKKKLLDRVRDAICTKHYSTRTEKSYVNWIKRFILFHDKRHPREMGANVGMAGHCFFGCLLGFKAQIFQEDALAFTHTGDF
jgi:hypothetical protein